ncbi:MAG TPA: twin-arginine translocase TatA/TatE family subunit [Leucothrix mucor]|uniref:Sec-independent protein translocase protein TatA n=1 Tax=Leucothrix mucor TaxID=45248 RepID=A0A7V2WUJ6_LEUMU|nr:twin-arginine translocase TatA/TatE family subunit [Leucothrix mucor]
MLFAFGMPSTGSLILILVIVLVLFGTKRLRSAGGDLGGAIKNFKKSMKDAQEGNKDNDKAPEQVVQDKGNVIDGESRVKDKNKA